MRWCPGGRYFDGSHIGLSLCLNIGTWSYLSSVLATASHRGALFTAQYGVMLAVP